MITGTALDLIPYAGSALWGIGALFWALLGWNLWWALRKPGGLIRKLLWASPALAHLTLTIVPNVQFRWQQGKAIARYEQYCRTVAGTRIHKQVKGVDGIVLMRWRPKDMETEAQFTLDDPYAHSCGGEDCIKRLLRATSGLELDPQKSLAKFWNTPYEGYRFVESKDPNDGQLYRYTLRLFRPHDRDPKWIEDLIEQELVKTKIDRFSARYGITWDDLSTTADRQHWIAGSTLKVIDLKTHEILAERVGYMIEMGQGSREGFRQPWLFATDNACPPLPKFKVGWRAQIDLSDMRYFAKSALKVPQPTAEE